MFIRSLRAAYAFSKKARRYLFMKKTKLPKNRTSPEKNKSFFVSVLIGTLIALAVGLLLLVIFTVIGLKLEDPEKFAPILALFSLFLTAVLGGYLSARTHKESGLFCGAASGILLIGILVLLVFACSFSIQLSLFAISAPAVIVLSALSGIGGVNGGRKKKPKRKKGF